MLLAAGDTLAGPNDSFTVSATLAGLDTATITGIITNEVPRPLFPTREKLDTGVDRLATSRIRNQCRSGSTLFDPLSHGISVSSYQIIQRHHTVFHLLYILHPQIDAS